MQTSTERVPKWRVALRLIFGGVIVSAAVAGWFGLRDLVASLPPSAGYGSDIRSLFYYDLQLFVMGSSPLQNAPGPFTANLEYARFAAPVATVYALLEAGGALFAGRLSRLRTRHRRHHVIVTGDTTSAAALVTTLEQELRLPVALRWMWWRRRPVIGVKDTTTAASLIAAGVRGAATVYACSDDRDDCIANVAVAQLAASAKRFRLFTKPLRVYAHVSDPTLALAIRARWLGLPGTDTPAVEFFNVDELAARVCLSDGDLPPAGATGDVLVVGWGPFAQALIVEYARRWQLRPDPSIETVTVTVVGASEDDLADLSQRWDVVREALVLRRAEDLKSVVAQPYRTFVCSMNEDVALRTALVAHQLWHGGTNSVVVRLNVLARPEVFDSGKATLLDTVDRRLRFVSVADLALSPTVLAEGLVEQLAKSIHRQYLLELARDADRRKVARPSGQPWLQLSEDFKNANRSPARDIGRKLAVIGATVAPSTPPRSRFAFSAAEVEQLAEQEHDRWWRERKDSGWVYAEKRDDSRKRHPCMVAWDKLPASQQEIDRQSVRNLVFVLADVGLQIIRLGVAYPSAAAVALPRQVTVGQ